MARPPPVYPIFVSLNVNTCCSWLRCSEEQNRTRSNLRQSCLDILDLHWTERWNQYFSTLWYLIPLSQGLIENSWYFPAGLMLRSEQALFIFLKCHLKTFVKILWSLTLEITRYEESGSHASKVKTLKIKVMFVTDSVTSYIPVMTYICVSVAILIVILWSLLIMYTELSSRRSVASYQICYNRLCNIPYTVMSQVPGQRHTSYRNGGNLLASLNSGSVTMFADSGYIRHNNH